VADLPLGLRLSRQAGWNQTEADWRRLLALQPDGSFAAEWQGVACGTALALLFGPVAWVAMVLVDEALRGRGIGTALMRHVLAFLDGRGIKTVRLDATPLGRPLYERLGFVEQFCLARYDGMLPPAPAVAGVETAPPKEWDQLAALDATITGTDRRRVLVSLFAEQPGQVRCFRRGGEAVGFLAARPGARATHLGPCLVDAEAGPLLLDDAGHRLAGQRVFLDVPAANAAAARWAEGRGLVVQRHLTRMVRGVAVCERLEGLWASSGPEKG
jgi:GNAT superfamily N-acetyltransferase